MKTLSVKLTSTSCNFKTSKMDSPTKTNSSCQTLTSSNPPLKNPTGSIVDKTDELEHLEELNDTFTPEISNNFETPIIMNNSKKTLNQFKNIRFV